jgi:NAD(P)H-hydrate repair Nnr-like enzyme with NAD(P)H-hydrate dehydratase domain
LDATAATVWGVHLHALAGEALEQDIGPDGVMARDFIDRLPQVIRYLRKYTSPKGDSKRVGLRPA